MRGLRKKEDDKFERYLELVQTEAEKVGYVFFLDNAELKSVVIGEFECCDMYGWLLKTDATDAFEPYFLANSERQFEYDDYYVYVDFEVQGEEIRIIFSQKEIKYDL